MTDRLLDVDPTWCWEPLSLNEAGLPATDHNGGLWIRLTVCGVTRLGYGDADGKQGGNAVKEAIGDAIRNAAMRFGAALDLWHKGDLHADEDVVPDEPEAIKPPRWSEPDSIYTGKSKLHAGLNSHQAELRRIGDDGVYDDLDGYLTSPEYIEFIRVAQKYSSHYLEGGHPAPDEFIGCFALEQRARDLIALRSNQPAQEESANV